MNPNNEIPKLQYREQNSTVIDDTSEYLRCTDCGADTFMENSFQMRNPIWDLAYPDYGEGIGVGSSRPCIDYFQKRLGRKLTRNDFTRGDINDPDPRWHSALLLEILNTGEWKVKLDR